MGTHRQTIAKPRAAVSQNWSLAFSAVFFIVAFVSTAMIYDMAHANSSLFSALDTNSDKRLSLAEFLEAFPTLNEKDFDLVDTDDDQLITQAEFAPYELAAGN